MPKNKGYSKEPWYGSYRGMMARCENPKTHNYDKYGGRNELERVASWERIPYSFVGGFRCSCCGTKTLEKYWNFCPNCGARMVKK